MSEEVIPTPVVETPAPIEPGSPAYNAQLAAEGNAATGNVPAKFVGEDGQVNTEGLAQAYMELEKKMSQPQAERAPAEASAEVEAPAAPEALVDELRVPDVPEVPEVEASDTNPNVVSDDDMSQFVGEIMRSGDITPESRAALNEKGIPDSLVNSMVEGQRAKMQQQFKLAGDIVGSEDKLSKIFGWAANNLDVGQRAAINAGLAGTASEATLRGLAAMYDKAESDLPAKSNEPREAPRYGSNPSGRAVVGGFADKREYYAATNDPKYIADPKYRRSVEERMIKTDWSTLG